MRPAPALSLFALSLGLAATADPAAAVQPKAETIKLNKLSAPAPAGWVSEKPKNNLRSYQFQIPGEKDGPPGEFMVMAGSNRKSETVFPRWKAQFVPSDGKTLEDISKVSNLALKGATVELLDATGTWQYREGGPFDKKAKEEMKDNYRVVWAVVVEPEEAFHLRLSGPKAVVDKQYPAFEAWLKALK